MSRPPYETTIGLETHVQLNTASKAFCGDRNHFGAAPNELISPVSLGYPGTLPVLNEKQVRAAVKLGLALGCRINPRSTFDRKNYFYADLPKGYQITQERNPICLGGALPLRDLTAPASPPRTIPLHHIHMEEDAGKSIHTADEPYTRIDLNRAGTPLLEIVTEPDLHSAAEVDAFMSGMRRLVRWLGISDGNMQEGSLRCDVNISVRPLGQEAFGTRCEIKNMNSMKYARGAVAYEVRRQIELLESGKSVVQQTRQYDPATGTTSALRNKEEAHDYRYFPDPDLPPVVLDEAYLRELNDEMGTLPWEAFAKLQTTYGLSVADADIISRDRENYETFLRYVTANPDLGTLTKLWINRIMPWATTQGRSITELPLKPATLLSLQQLITEGKISAAAASSKLLPSLLTEPGDPQTRGEALGLLLNDDADFTDGLADQVIAANPDKVAAYRKGKKGLIGFFMGEVMKLSKGTAEPRATKELLQRKLQ